MQFGYLSMEEDKAMALIRKTTNFVYQPPQPRGWSSLGSEKEIEGTWVKDTRTRVRICIPRGRMNCRVRFGNCFLRVALMYQPSCLLPCCQGKPG